MCKKKDAENPQERTGYCSYRQKIISALERLVNQRDTRNERDKANDRFEKWVRWPLEKKRYRIEIATFVVAVFGLLAACFAAVFSYHQLGIYRQQLGVMRTETIEANRAWVAVSPLPVITGPTNYRILVDISYANAGKSPAHFLKWNQKTGEVPLNPPGDISKVNLGPNNTCDGLKPDPKGSTSFPGSELLSDLAKSSPIHYPFTQIPTEPPLYLDEMKKTGREAVWIQGCVVYETTSGKTGTTKFCSIFVPDPSINAQSSQQIIGGAADCPSGGIDAE